MANPKIAVEARPDRRIRRKSSQRTFDTAKANQVSQTYAFAYILRNSNYQLSSLSVLPEFAYRRVLLTGTWDPDPSHTVFLGPRTRDNVLGYNVISPLKRGDGASTVLVNRGFISRDALERARQVTTGISIRPDAQKVSALVADAAQQGTVKIEGMITAPAKRNIFTPDNKPDIGEWYWADAEAMAKIASGGGGDVQPILIDELFSELFLLLLFDM